VEEGGGGAGSSEVDGGALGSVVGAGSALELGVSGSWATAPAVAPPNARTTAVVNAPNLSSVRLTDLSDKEITPKPIGVECGEESPETRDRPVYRRQSPASACQTSEKYRINNARGSGNRSRKIYVREGNRETAKSVSIAGDDCVPPRR
jgi:hypothetical protein